MRAIYIPVARPRRERWGVAEAWARLHDADVFDFLKRIFAGMTEEQAGQEFLDLVEAVQPQVIHMHAGHPNYINKWLQRARGRAPGVCIMQWYGDWREQALGMVTDRNDICDVLLLSNKEPSNIALYQGKRAQVRYLQTAVPRAVPRPDRIKYPYDICYIINWRDCFQRSGARNDLIIELDKRYGSRAGLWGHSWEGRMDRKCVELPYYDQLDLNASCKCCVSFSNKTASWYHSTRMLFCLYSGTCTVADRFPGCEELFRDGEEIVYFDPDVPGDVIEKIEWVLSNPEKATEIGARGRQAIEAGHLWDHRIMEITDKIYPQFMDAR